MSMPLSHTDHTETLTGLSTIRAYREQVGFFPIKISIFVLNAPQNASVSNAEAGLDKENRAYYMTISIQRWLSVRLDFFGNILIFGIALFASGFRHTVNPSKVGVVLSYALGSKSFIRRP